MKLQRVRIQNFRGHADTSLDFSKHHAIVGPNGSGKTAILEAINYGTSPFYLSSRLDERDFHNEDLGDIFIGLSFDRPFALKVADGYTQQHVLSNEIELRVKRRERAAPRRAFSEPFSISHVCPPLCYDALPQLTVELPGELTKDDLPLSLKTTRSGYELERKGGKRMSLRWDSLAMSPEIIGLPDVFYFDRDREKETRVGFNSLFTKIAKDLNWRYRKAWTQADALNRWDQYYSPVIEAVEDKKKGTVLGPLRETMSKMLGVDVSALEISLLDLEQPFSKSFLSFRDGTNHVGLDGAGSGVGMLAALLLLEQVSERAGGDLIPLIDEPEMHLHPQLQAALGHHLRADAAQTIVSTHSPLFVDLGNWRGISRVTGGECAPQEAVLAASHLGKPLSAHLDEIPKYHQNETIFSPQDSEMLFARKLLLVEGPVEKYGLPRLAVVLGLDLSQLTIVSCNGKSKIPQYDLVARAFGIDAYLLFDLDGKPETDPENATICDVAKSRPAHRLPTSFEALLGIGANASQKASKALMCIDAMTTVESIPPEIRDALAAISAWAGEANA